MGGRKELKPFVIESIYKPTRGWDVHSYEEASDLLSAMKDAIAASGNHLILTTGQKASSKWSSQNLERKLKKAFPNKRILRIDSHTIADPSHPAFGCLSKNLPIFLAEYDLVLCSPTLESGVSLDLHGHFAGVWAFLAASRQKTALDSFSLGYVTTTCRAICMWQREALILLSLAMVLPKQKRFWSMKTKRQR
jgi:hypothetical protein